MKVKDQVCSLKLAKRLKELGVKQQSTWYWVHHTAFTFEQTPKLVEGWNLIYKDKMRPYRQMVFSTFTVAELGEMLPFLIENNRIIYYLPCKSNKNVEFTPIVGSKREIEWFWYAKEGSGYAKTEANARAKMLIYLLENNLIKGGI